MLKRINKLGYWLLFQPYLYFLAMPIGIFQRSKLVKNLHMTVWLTFTFHFQRSKTNVHTHTHTQNYISESVSHLVVPNSLWSHELQPTKLLCPWDFPGKDTGVVCHFLLQGLFLTQEGSSPGFLHCREFLYWLSYEVSPKYVERHLLWGIDFGSWDYGDYGLINPIIYCLLEG